MPVPVSLSEAKAAVHEIHEAYHHPRYENHFHNAMLDLMKVSDFLLQVEQQEPSMLELRGALALLTSAEQKLLAEWDRATGGMAEAERAAYHMVTTAKGELWVQYRELLHPVTRCPCCNQKIP